MVYLLAAACALSNALASVLQRMGVEDAPEADTLKLSLLTHASSVACGCSGLSSS